MCDRIIVLAGLSIEPTRFGVVRAWMDVCDGARIAGWAQDVEHLDAPVCLDIVVDGEIVAMTLAEKYRADIAAAGVGDVHHGFDLDLEKPLARGVAHVVEVRRSADGVRICAKAMDAAGVWTALLGYVGTLTHRGIVGWAWETDAPNQPVPLLVTIGTRVLARCTADQYREDLAIEGMGSGYVGFELRLPPKLLSPRKGYEISVRREGDGLHLPGSPYVLTSHDTP